MTIDQAGGLLTSGAVEWPVRTQRLTLRPARQDDAAAVLAYRRLPEVSRWLASAPAARDWPEYFAGRLSKTLVIERTGAVIGDLMVTVEDGWAQAEVADRARDCEAELGWVLDPAHAGQGFATEAVREAIRICFTDLGLRRVTANCFAANEPSWRLMERLGMRREISAVKDSLHRDLGWLDGYGYALLAEEWRAGSPGVGQ
jgi:RimJ/RimL family protein N-acetyltransferase